MGEKWKQWQILSSWAPKSLQTVTAAMKLRHLLLGRKAMTNLDSALKNRHYFVDKGPSSQSYGFPSSHGWMCKLDHKESWALKNFAFELWCWRRLLRVPWTARRSNQSTQRKSTLNIHWKDRCWSWCSSTLATWFEGPIHWKRPWCWERLKAEWEGVTDDEMVGQHHRLSGHESEQTLKVVKVRKIWCATVHGVAKSWTWLRD